MSQLIAKEYKCFEDIRHVRSNGSEYWYARELATVLDYAKWENFSKVIKRAMIACENSGHDPADDFPEVRKIVEAGAATKGVVAYELSRIEYSRRRMIPRRLCCCFILFYRPASY